MGLNDLGVNYFFNVVDACGFNLKGLRVCELGNTRVRKSAYRIIDNLIGVRCRSFKTVLESLGAVSVSIDLNGKNRALPLDLGKDIDVSSLGGQFDVVLNAGTTEHIDNQKVVFNNIYNFCKTGGISINIVPNVGARHGKHQYSFEFFDDMKEKWFIVNFSTQGVTYYKKYRTKRDHFKYVFCTLRKL